LHGPIAVDKVSVQFGRTICFLEDFMPISLTCSSCDSRFKVKEQFAGRKIKCPECGQGIAVPALQEDEEEESRSQERAAIQEQRNGSARKKARSAAPEDEEAAPRKKQKVKKSIWQTDMNDLNAAFRNFDIRRFTPAGWLLFVVALAVGGVCLVVCHQTFGQPDPGEAPIVHYGFGALGGALGGLGTFYAGMGLLYLLGIRVIRPK
jgi:hypothetical protein